MSKRLIVRYLTGNCSNEEHLQVEQWLASSSANKSEFEKIRALYEGASIPKSVDFDVELALARVKHRIELIEKAPVRTMLRKRNTFKLNRIAAVFVLLFSVGIASFYFLSPKQSTEMICQETSIQQKQEIVLPDGSKVYLNAASGIQYSADFGNTIREIHFQGEAYFDIAPDASKPFIIHTKDIGVEVIGTSFNLRAFEQKGDYQIDLLKGKVRFYSVDPQSGEKMEQVYLVPGERARYTVESNMIVKEMNLNNNYLAWHNGILEFTDCPLSEVVKTLSQAYQVTIELDPSLANQKLTARFQQQKLESITEALHVIFGCTAETKNGKIILR